MISLHERSVYPSRYALKEEFGVDMIATTGNGKKVWDSELIELGYRSDFDK